MSGNLIMSITDHELSRLAALLEIHMNASVYRDPAIAQRDIMTAQKLSYLLAMMRQKGRRAIVIDTTKELGMNEKPQTENVTESPDTDSRPQWILDATDEHACNYDPNDPLTPDEVIWMAREIGSGDMTSDELLRRSK